MAWLMHDQRDKPRRALLCAVQLPSVDDAELEGSLIELRRLARTLGIEVVGQTSQRRASFDPGAYLGKGKREELKARIEAGEADTLLIDHEVSPSQARNLEKDTGADVMDRTAVILDIFHRHANSRAAKAQVEMVRLEYMAPRMREAASENNSEGRQGGAPGGRGAGESGMELDRRKIRDRIAELAKELESMDRERQTQRARRSNMPRVALVGYTNAGKSTLMRALTASDVYVADKLFATLDTTVRQLLPETSPKILMSDTVGFIKKLPHGLVASFKSTLDEALEASLLAHVIDASDANFEQQLEVTETVLKEIGAGEVPRVLVFNKIDRLSAAGGESSGSDAEEVKRAALLARWPDAMVISAKRDADVAALRERFVAFFNAAREEAELAIPFDKQAVRAEIHASCEVLDEAWDEHGAKLRVRAEPATLARIRQRLEA